MGCKQSTMNNPLFPEEIAASNNNSNVNQNLMVLLFDDELRHLRFFAEQFEIHRVQNLFEQDSVDRSNDVTASSVSSPYQN